MNTSLSTEIISSPASALQPAPLFTPTPKAAKRVLEFFTAQVNFHTRKAYLNATRRSAAWCDEKGIGHLAGVQAFHVAAFIKELQSGFSAPTEPGRAANAVRLPGDGPCARREPGPRRARPQTCRQKRAGGPC